MTSAIPVTEEEIQGFVDDRLDPATCDRVRQHLANVPEDARRVEDYCRHRQMLRDALRPLAEEAIPGRLRNVGQRRPQPDAVVVPFRSRLRSWGAMGRNALPNMPLAQAASIALVCLAAGGVLGWRLAPSPSPWMLGVRPLAEEAADSYRAYVSDGTHPVEVSSSDLPALSAWVSARLGKKVEAPDRIKGLRLLGGRVVPTSRGPAAMFMYTDAEGRASPAVLLVCPLSLHGNAPMVEGEESRLTSVTWSVNGVGYSLVGEMPGPKLRSMAEDARHAFGQDT